MDKGPRLGLAGAHLLLGHVGEEKAVYLREQAGVSVEVEMAWLCLRMTRITSK